MSLRTLRRSIIAATSVLAVGGSLAVASSASAVAIPWGSATDTGSTSVYGLYNQASTGLIQGQNLIVGANGLAAAAIGNPTPTVVDAGFTTKFTTPSQLTTANVTEIATDIAAAGNTSQLELAVCVFSVYPTATKDTSQNDAIVACKTPGSPYLAAAVTAFTTGSGTTAGVQPGVAAAAASWPQLSGLLTQLASAPGTLNSLDGNVSITSAATVTQASSQKAPAKTGTKYSITATVNGAASGNYVLPSGFTMTFPNNFLVNTALIAYELPVSDEANPPAAKAIGTATLVTPVGPSFGFGGTTVTGSVFVIDASGNPAQPSLELSFGSGIYLLGTFPKTLTFPLTLTFGEASVFGAADPIPFNSLALSFPAKTSPVKALSCTSLGQVGGAGTDEIAGLAAQFGDTTDGYAPTGISPVNFASTNTVVTNVCAPTLGKTTVAGIKKGAPTVGITLKAGSKFSNAVFTLPSGVTAKGLVAKDLKVTGAKVKSVKVKGAKVTVTFKSATKSATVKFVKGLSVSKKLVTAVTKKKTKSLVIKFTVKYASATSTAGSVTVKKLS